MEYVSTTFGPLRRTVACLLSAALVLAAQQPAVEAAMVRVRTAPAAPAGLGSAASASLFPPASGGAAFGNAGTPLLGSSGLALPSILPSVRTQAVRDAPGLLAGPAAVSAPPAVRAAAGQGAAAQKRRAAFEKVSPSFAGLAPFAEKAGKKDFAKTGAGLSSGFYDGALEAVGAVAAVSPVRSAGKLVKRLLGATDLGKRRSFEKDAVPDSPEAVERPKGLLRFVPAKWRAKLVHALTLKDAPGSIARGVALGLVIGMTPTVGIQWAAALVLSKIFKASTPAAMSLIWLSNPLTLAPLYWLDYQIGGFLFPGAGASPEAWSGLLNLMSDGFFQALPQLLGVGAQVFLTSLLGGLVLGAALGIPGYFLARGAVRRYQARQKAKASRQGRETPAA